MTWRRRLGRYRDLLFGDRLGAALFLGTLCWVALTWRVGFFIADTYAVANTLVNVAEGHLYIETVEYSLTLGSSQPGLHVVDGRVYGRNYGQVYLALPVYVTLDLLSSVVDLRVLALGGVSGAALGAAHQFGGVVDCRARAVTLASIVVTLLFVLNVGGAAAMDPRWAAVLALQTTTAVAAGVVAVGLYRLLSTTGGRRVGFAVGALAVAGTPIGLWATMPKRHVLTAALVVVTLVAFYHSRDGSRTVHGIAYGAAAFTTAVHGGEGAVLLAVLVPVDLVTLPRVSGRAVTAAAVGLAVGLAPFLLTNTVISGNPLLPPRWLPPFRGGKIGPGGVVQTADGANESPNAVRKAGVATVLAATSVLDALLARISETLGATTDIEKLYHVFVRSGRIPGVVYSRNDLAVVELSFLESVPLCGSVLLGLSTVVSGAIGAVSRPERRLRTIVDEVRTPSGATDLLAVGFLFVLTASYMPKLPLYSQITVRYLLPTVPLWLYLLGRVPQVRAAVDEHIRVVLATLVVGLTVGTATLAGILIWLDPALGEAMQFQALVNLGLAVVATVAVGVGARRDRPAIGAVAIGVVGAAGGALVVLAGLVYFPYGQTLLPVSGWLADLIPLL